MDNELELKRRCLTLISRIAARAANSPDHDHVRDTLFELDYALKRSPNAANPSTSDIRPDTFRDLRRLHQDLDFIDVTGDEFTVFHFLKYSTRSTWN